MGIKIALHHAHRVPFHLELFAGQFLVAIGVQLCKEVIVLAVEAKLLKGDEAVRICVVALEQREVGLHSQVLEVSLEFLFGDPIVAARVHHVEDL